jgi:antitoxin component YwqK of YwqJK toxin-antitoxin module
MCVTALRGFCQELLYRSNEFGMLLERIEPYRRDQWEWTMQVERNGSNEVRRLSDKGKEVRRWEISLTKGGAQKVERELQGDVLVARRLYDAKGVLLQEDQYEAGEISQKSLFTYAGGRLTRMRVLAPDGSLLYSEEYLYATSGALRVVRRIGAPEDARLSAYIMGSSGLSEERNTIGDALYINRYDAQGNMVCHEQQTGGATVSREDFAFRPDSDLLLFSTERHPGEGKVIDRGYDDKGRLASEITTVKGAVVETVLYSRNDKGGVKQKTRRSAAGLETWKYTLDDSGAVVREEYYQRGALAKVTVHGEGKLRTEELYKGGELILKVYYDGDTRLREEVYSGGQLLRERRYE